MTLKTIKAFKSKAEGSNLGLYAIIALLACTLFFVIVGFILWVFMNRKKKTMTRECQTTDSLDQTTMTRRLPFVINKKQAKSIDPNNMIVTENNIDNSRARDRKIISRIVTQSTDSQFTNKIYQPANFRNISTSEKKTLKKIKNIFERNKKTSVKGDVRDTEGKQKEKKSSTERINEEKKGTIKGGQKENKKIISKTSNTKKNSRLSKSNTKQETRDNLSNKVTVDTAEKSLKNFLALSDNKMFFKYSNRENQSII